MGGFFGAWGRIHEDRKRRQALAVSMHAQTTHPPGTLRFLSWQESLGVPKRRCRVHHREDRCWKKEAPPCLT